MPFKRGQSGNPGGRPKVVAEVKALAQEHTAEAMDALVAIVKDKKAPAAARVSAASAILDRGYGKPAQSLDVTHRRGAVDMTDDELIAIASGSGERAAAETAGAKKLPSVH